MSIYLDYMATTPVDPRVAEKIQPYLTDPAYAGNPSALEHDYGSRAMEAVQFAKHQVADAIHGHPDGITWTSGATEAINLAIKGALAHYSRKGKHVITWATEHQAVLSVFEALEQQGLAEVTILPVKPDGLVDLDTLEEACRQDTVLVSVCHVNNEIGVVQNLATIADLVAAHGALLHVDAAQSVGKVALDVSATPLDFVTLSAHKSYGPKGIGALYCRQKPRRHLSPQIHGGQQQRQRAGTLPVHQIVGMGEAFALAVAGMPEETTRIHSQASRILEALLTCPHVHMNGSLEQRVPHNLNLTFGGHSRQKIFAALSDLAVVSASACQSQYGHASHVLHALGLDDDAIQSTIRLSLGRFTTDEEIEVVIDRCQELIGA